MSMCYSHLNVNNIDVKECTGGLKENGDMYDYHNADSLLIISCPRKKSTNINTMLFFIVSCYTMSSNYFNILMYNFFELY